MTAASSTTGLPQILIARNGTDRVLRGVIDRLGRAGYQVKETESLPVGTHGTGASVEDSLSGVGMAFLVVRPDDGRDSGGPIRPFHRILREAGLMQGRLGMDRVMLLVDDSVKGLSADAGLGVIRYPASDPESKYDEIENAIKFAFPPRPRDLNTHDPIADQVREDALRIPWILVAVVVLAAIIPLTLAFTAAIRASDGGTASGDDDGGLLGGLSLPETTEVGGLTEDLARARSGSGSAAGPGFGIGDPSRTPAAPDVQLDGGDQLLQASCRIDVRKTLVLGDSIACTGVGQLLVSGFEGPWHNELESIALSEGVVGEATIEPRSDGSTAGPPVVNLVPGTVTLNEVDARFGVEAITVHFSANNQHIHFYQPEDRGGAAATLTFTLYS